MEEIEAKQIYPKRYKIDDKDCQMLVDVLLYEPLEQPSDLNVCRLFYTDGQEITLEDPAYTALKNYARERLEKLRTDGKLRLD